MRRCRAPLAPPRTPRAARCAAAVAVTLAAALVLSPARGRGSFSHAPPALASAGALARGLRAPRSADSLLEIAVGNDVSGDDTRLVRQGTLVAGPGVPEVDLALVNGTADYEHEYVFAPEPGRTIADYEFVPVSSNEGVLARGDVDVSLVAVGENLYNVTAAFQFDRSVGVTDFTLNIVDTETNATVSTNSTSFTLVGMSFFHTPASGSRQLVGGDQGALVLSVSDLISNDKVALETFVQFADGSNSSNALAVPLDTILVSFSGLQRQLIYNADACSATVGINDGSSISLPNACGLGFSTNSVNGLYAEPQLAFDFETNRNGSFVALFEWDELVAGSDLDALGYETYLEVLISGEVAPLVTAISPEGPFSSTGGDLVTVTVENLPGDASISSTWTYDLAILFASNNSRSATLTETTVDSSTGKTVFTFELPSGTGAELPWTFTATKPGDGGVLSGIDNTENGYKFSFVEEGESVIESITPDSGPVEGGTVVTILGNFKNFDLQDASSFISIGTTVIDKALVTSSSDSQIVFATPPVTSISGGSLSSGAFDVTVTSNGTTSEPVQYTYLEADESTIDSLSPSSGPASGGTVVTILGSFANFDVNEESSYITIGSTVIDKSLITASSNKEITFTTPAQSDLGSESTDGAFQITVTSNGVTSNPAQFTYVAPSPSIISDLSPQSGPSEGGTSVTVSGSFKDFDINNSSSFISMGTTVIDSSFVTFASETQIIFNTPPKDTVAGGSATGIFDVTVTSNGITSEPAQFTYVDTVISQILSLTPSSGPDSGGTVVTVTGTFTNFNVNDDSSFIMFGTTQIDRSLIISASEDQIVFNTPPRSQLSGDTSDGVFDVTVTSNGTQSEAVQFTFVSPGISNLTSISPSSGPEDGGTLVTLSGTFAGFELDSDLSYITIGTTVIEKSLISSISESAITFTTPPEQVVAGGTEEAVYEITVTAAGVTSGPLNFTYERVPVLSAIEPATAPLEGNTRVVLLGSFVGFSPASGSYVSFGNLQIDPSSIVSFTSSSIVVSVPALTDIDSSGTVFRYPVTVTVLSETSNSVDFTFLAPVVIDSIFPSSGAEDGGTLVTLAGQFVNYLPENSGIYFGGQKLDNSLVTSYTDNQITFLTAEKDAIGSSFQYDVSVVIGDLRSNDVRYEYESTAFSVGIESSGGSFVTSGVYQLGACGNSFYRAQIPSSAKAQGAVFSWTLTDASGADVISDSDSLSNSETFFVPYEKLTEFSVYNLNLVVTTRFFNGSASMQLMRVSAQNIGVHIFNPDEVSPGYPNTTLTIQADIGVPGCIDKDFVTESQEITYRWTYRGNTYEFSYLNETVDETVLGPTLLGREFKVPQAFMEYGSFPLSLTAFYTRNSSISGSDTTRVVISPSTLIAQINAGQSETVVSATRDVELTGENSWDPDVLSGERNENLSYVWGCEYGSDSTLQNLTSCDDTNLVPGNRERSFSVSTESLSEVQVDSEKVYIKYSLSVGKRSTNATGAIIDRVSPTTFLVVTLVESQLLEYEQLERIEIRDNLTTLADPFNVKYYQDVIVSPVSKTNATTWTFEIVEPRIQSTLLNIPGNLIPFAGFWDVGDSAGRTQLGIRGNVLDPGTTYKFLIRSSRTGFEENQDIIDIITVQAPSLTIAPLPKSAGTTNDTFIISAYTSYDDDFKFFFLLEDEFGFKTCIGGCQGTSLVRFKLLSEGTYRVTCEVYDSLGFTLVASSTSATNITVTTEIQANASLAVFDIELESAFVSGDHAHFQQLGIDIVKYVLSNDGSNDSIEDSETVANFTKNLNHIVANSVPNSEQSAGYVTTAAALALLTNDLGIAFSTETLYFLVNITVNSVTRTPEAVALQQVSELLTFHNLTTELVLQSNVVGTSRRRLLQSDSASGNTNVHMLVADYYEVMKDIVAVAALKHVSCGATIRLDTEAPQRTTSGLTQRMWIARQGESSSSDLDDNERRKTAAAKYVNTADTQSSSVSWHLGHVCNPEQGSELFLDFGENQSSCKFGWCREVFEERFKNIYFMLAKTPNYVYLSGLRRNTTLAEGLATVAVFEIRPNNTIADASVPLDDCYRLNIPVPKSVTVDINNTMDLTVEETEFQSPKPARLTPEKVWNVDSGNLTPGYYFANFSGPLSVNISNSVDEDFSDVSFSFRHMGLYTIATKVAWDGGFFSLDGYFLNVLETSGTALTILALIAVASVAGWFLATKVATFAGAAPPVEVDFTYLERDVYGRGTAIDMMDGQ